MIAQPPPPQTLTRQAFFLVFLCTLSGAAAQIFMKLGANKISHPSIAQILTNVPLLIGYCLYGVNTLMLSAALRTAPLSLLYPIISLTYLWVTFLSVMIFHESVNLFKIAGLAIVVTGVAVLGFGGRK